MKIRDLEYWKNRDLLEEFNVYTIYNEETEDYDFFYGNELDYDKNYEFDYFDGDEFEDFVNNFLVKERNNYLVFAMGYGWRHLNGYKFTETVRDALYRNYDCTFSISGVSKGEKTVMLSEYSHDNPTGCSLLITSLTDREYDRLYNADFETVEKFAKKQLDKVVTENKKSKYIAELQLKNAI